MNLFPNQSDVSGQSAGQAKNDQASRGFNPQMLVVAREARGLTQKELAERTGLAQGTVSKLEDGLIGLSDDLAERFERALGFPRNFFFIRRRIEWGNVALYRRRITIPASLLKQCEAQMNIIKMNIAQLLAAAEPIPCQVPCLDPEENGGVKRIAQLTRTAFKLPPGPVRNLTEVVEGAGCIIVPFDFGTRKIDGCSDFVGETPILFVNTALNAVRYRFTVAHELGHLTMHRLPSDSDAQEDEANHFARELLMPEQDAKATLLPLNIDRLARQKLRWRVSMQAILYHAKCLNVINERTFRYYWMILGRLGYRENEPHDKDIPKEGPRLLRELIDMHLQDLSTTISQLAQELSIAEDDLATWLMARPALRVV